MYAYLLMFNSTIWPNSAPLQYINFWNLGDLDFHLSRSFKAKYDGVIGLPIYDFLLMYNSKYMFISPRLAVIASQKILKLPYLLLSAHILENVFEWNWKMCCFFFKKIQNVRADCPEKATTKILKKSGH